VSLGTFSEATDGTICPGVDSASKNEYRIFQGVSVTTLQPSQCRKSRKSEALTQRIPKGRLKPAAGKLYFFFTLHNEDNDNEYHYRTHNSHTRMNPFDILTSYYSGSQSPAVSTISSTSGYCRRSCGSRNCSSISLFLHAWQSARFAYLTSLNLIDETMFAKSTVYKASHYTVLSSLLLTFVKQKTSPQQDVSTYAKLNQEKLKNLTT
jgi:hypothetical protein